MKKLAIQNPFPILFALILAAILLILVTPGRAQISYTTAAANYTQNFNNLYGTVPANNTIQVASILPAGWVFTEALANANTTLRNDNGSSGTGDTYLDGTTNSNERAFGSYASGSLTSQFGASFTNNTGATLTQFTLSYTGEQWKDGGSGAAVINKLAFSYGIGATSITAGTYVNVTQLDFTALVNNLTADVTTDGNNATYRASVSYNVTGISWASGTTMFIRWSDANDAGNDDNLAVDDLTFSANVTTSPAISLVGTTLSGFCTSAGTASAYQTFTVSGAYLTGNLTVTPPAGFEVSTDGGSTYGTSQNVPVAGGNVTGGPLTVRVRIASSASAGSPGGSIAISGGGATTQNVTVSGTVGDAATLAAGDISILGFNGTDPDRFAFVNWVSIPNLTKINFTDNAWDGSALLANENTLVWQNNTGSAIPVGTVILFENGTGFDLGTIVTGTMSGISNGGENLFAYQGPSCNPTFLYGIISGLASWTYTPGNNATSGLPSALSSYNIILGANGNGQYTASRSNQATIALYKPIVNNVTNWTTSASIVNVSSTDFSTGTNPAVNLTVSSNTATETGTPTITVTLTASAPVIGDQTVTLAVTGTGITGTDYSLSSTTLTILNGATTGTATFQILDDTNVEGSETATLTISSPSSGIILGTTISQNISITDNDGSTFYSQASGNANTGAIWDIIPSGTGQTIASLGGFSNLRNIVVQSGHTVTIATSGTDVLNLTVNAGGTLKTGGTTNVYFDVFGNITCNGTMGAGSANDGLSFNIENNTCVLSGTGTIDLSRIRKDATTPVTSSIAINADVNMRFNGASFYNNANFTNFNITIGNGYTVNVMGDDGTNGEVSIDGTNGVSASERGGSITVNGSLIVSKKIYALSNNNATYPCSIIIGSSGIVRTFNIDLNINNPGFTAFTINSGGVLTVTNNFSHQGGTLTTNNGVIIGSGGSLMHGASTPSGGGTVSGNITIKRQGTTSPDKYNYWSSPVSGGTLPGSNGYAYNSSLGTNGYTDDNNPSPDPGWVAASGSMTNAKGYASKGAGLASFTGVPNNGPISIGVTSSGQPLSSTIAPSKFNLIGNPYPCGLTAFNATNGLVNLNSGVIAGSLYFWYDDGSNGSNYASNDYAVRTGVGGTAANSGGPAPTNNIGAGQGFIVEAIASGNVNFDNTMRNNNNSQFFKTEEDTFMNRIWLTLSNADLYNEVLIAFKSDATEERDLLYDAYKLRGNSQITYAAVQQQDEFAIVAFPPVTDERIIPLTAFVEVPGNYTITNKYAEYMESIPVYLEDRLLETYTDISNNGSYAAYMTEQNTVDRFFLHFAPLATSIPENATAQVKTYSNGNELIVLLSNFSEVKGNLRIIDMSGKEVLSQSNINLQNNFFSVNTVAFASGIYALNLVTETNSYTVKTFVK